ncbi:MAG: hypothetical protein IT369_15200 [Candidatus Latescibacteria bacterium]|nr:hypothetical protein [Candidatus Latescibacterota bacterium]
MSPPPALSAEEIGTFVGEGALILDRPLTWEIVGALLAALDSAEAGDGD